jgi:hypothetical protein
MEHRYTLTDEGTSAGAWWKRGTVLPELAWMYDQRRRLLIVTTRSDVRLEYRIVANAPMVDAGQTFLPGLALQIARRVTQQWRG